VDGVEYSTFEFEYLRKNPSTVRIRVLLFPNSVYSSTNTQKSVLAYYSSTSTFSITPSLKAIFAIKGLILSVIQKNFCSIMQRLPAKPTETKWMHIGMKVTNISTSDFQVLILKKIYSTSTQVQLLYSNSAIVLPKA